MRSPSEADDREPAGRAWSRRELVGAAAAAALAAGAAGCASARPPGGGGGEPAADAELDELFADLDADASRAVEPIDGEERRGRRERAARALRAAGLDALLVESGTTLEYLSGVRWGRSERLFGLVVLASGECFWIVPSFEAPKAELRIAAAEGLAPGEPGTAELVTWDEHEYAWNPLADALYGRGARRVAIDPEARLFVRDELAAALARRSGAARIESGRALVRGLRIRKDAHELELLRTANELTQRAIAAVAERLEPGLSGAELGARLRHAQRRLGLTDVWVLPLIGPAAAFPHGGHADLELARGDVVLVDTGGKLHGYASDITRTWVFDAAPSVEVERAWHVVRDAQRRAFEAVRPGVRCSELDRVARETIERAGYGSGYASFTHRLGHGIGMQGHEDPYLDAGNALELEPGMTFSDEPGVYLYGRFGVRIEDILAVTEGGAEAFGAWQRSPRSPAST